MSSASTSLSLVGRYLNALCYLVSGIVVIALSASSNKGSAVIIVVGVAMTLYGLYVGLTRGSYWVSSFTYVIPIVGIGLGIAAING